MSAESLREMHLEAAEDLIRILEGEVARLARERDEARAYQGVLASGWDNARAEVERLTRERDEALARVARTGELIAKSREAAEAEVKRLRRELDEVMEDRAMASLHAEKAWKEVERLRDVVRECVLALQEEARSCGLTEQAVRVLVAARAALEGGGR